MHKNYFDIVMEHIEENVIMPTEEIKREIPRLIGRHSRAFGEHFNMLTGYTLDYYIKQRRLNHAARALIRHREKAICDIALEYQFSDQSAFTRAIKAKYQVTPNEIRKEHLWVFEERFYFADFTGRAEADTNVAMLLRSLEIGGPNSSFELDLILEIEQLNDDFGFDIDTCYQIADLAERLGISLRGLAEYCQQAMHSRFCKVFGERLGSTMEFRTIHSVALEIVNRYAQLSGRAAPRLESDNAKLVTDILRQMQDEFPSESEIAEACAAITYIKNMSIPAEEIPEQDFSTPKMDKVYAAYQQALKDKHWMDFDDQVTFALQILKGRPGILAEYRNRFPYICVDEAQDTSKSQHELLQLLAGNQGNVFMVGDEDQSIYRFRGAFPQALMDFKDTYPNPYILWMETNYRSTPEIVNIAADFIKQNQNRYPKNMVAHRESGEAVKRIEVASRTKQYAYLLDVAKQIPTDTAVIYRDNDSAIPLIDLLDRKGVPYCCPKREFRFFTHKIVLDVIAFMKLQQDLRDTESFKRIYYKGFYFDKKTAEYACNNVNRRKITLTEALKIQAGQFKKIEDRVDKFIDYCNATVAMGQCQ